MKSKTEHTTRRDFIKKSALALTAFTIVPRHVLGGSGFIAPSDRVNIGMVGCGGMANNTIRGLIKLDDVRITAIADPAELWKNDDNTLYDSYTGWGPTKEFLESYYAAEKTPDQAIQVYKDFREMLKKEKGLDAIVCSTPDNNHAYVSITAMRAGKHVYCEKPLTHNIWESRKVREVARETGVATQMGNQLHALDGLRQTVEYLRAGVIGKVEEAHIFVPASRWLPGHTGGYPKSSDPVPEGFNWNLWLGPTPWRVYNKMYTPVTWRDFWDFGCGALGDFACHDMDIPTWAFNLHTPESVEAHPAGNEGSAEVASYGEIGYYKFLADGEQSPLNLTWYSGGLQPRLPDLLPRDVSLPSRGAMFVGDKGIILINGPGSSPQIFPESLRNSFTPPEPSIPRSKGHHREWIDAIKGGPAAMSNFEYGAQLNEITHLGVLSLRLGGKKIYWDSNNMKAVGLPEADEIIREPVRKGWEMV